MIFTWLICAAAAGLFGRGLYHSGVLAGWITQGLTQIEPAPSEAVVDLTDYWAENNRIMLKHEAALFRQVPSAFWLDPKRIGGLLIRPESPEFQRVLDDPTVTTEYLKPVPACPGCGRRSHAEIKVMAEHNGEASLYECERCGTEFLKGGIETERSRKKAARVRKIAKTKAEKESGFYDDLPVQLQRPPGVEPMLHEVMMVQSAPLVVPHNPKPTRRITVDDAYPALPCGCPHSTTVTHHTGPGYTYFRCGRCEKWWEPPSNDPTRGKVAQGEHVHARDDISPTAQMVWDKVWNKGLENHGMCPSAICQFPVDKRGGLYYCSNPDCNHHYKGWK